MSLVPIVKGIATFLPGVRRFTTRGSGGTGSARYCYSVWLRHFVMAHSVGLDPRVKAVAELGPGDSLGTGLAALLCGVEQYYACDAKAYAHSDHNLSIFDELIELFRRREPIPGGDEFPGIRPILADYSFPADLLDESRLKAALAPPRIESIREDLVNLSQRQQGKHIFYVAPWYDAGILREASVEWAFSQAVMEHVNDVSATYQALHRWLKPGGFMSHSIDFRCHHTADVWNGHWGYSDFTWKLIVGARIFLINRWPHSAHQEALRAAGFEIVLDQPETAPAGLTRVSLAERFRRLSDEDLRCCGAFMIARRE